MFQSIVISSHESFDNGLDLGLIAESLLFYGDVHLILDAGGLRQLLKLDGGKILDDLLEIPHLTLTFCPTLVGTITSNNGGIDVHSYVQMTFSSNGKNPNLKGTRSKSIDQLENLYFETVESSWSNKRKFKGIHQKISNANIYHSVGSVGVEAQAKNDINDAEYLEFAAGEMLKHYVGEENVPRRFSFKSIATHDGFFIDTDLDFNHLSALYQQRFRLESNNRVTPALLACGPLEARAFLAASMRYGAEFVAKRRHSEMIRRKISGLQFPRDSSAGQIAVFQEINFGTQYDIRISIGNSVDRFREFLGLLKRARTFRQWLGGQNPDEQLVKVYQDSVLAKSWLERLPVKLVRMFAFSGVGAAIDAQLGTIAGVAVGAADQLLLDRLLRGWRPNHFVDGTLRPFVQSGR